jgi:hypothetical protein
MIIIALLESLPRRGKMWVAPDEIRGDENGKMYLNPVGVQCEIK